MTTENTTKLVEQPSRELRDEELDTVTGGIIGILVGRGNPGPWIPPGPANIQLL